MQTVFTLSLPMGDPTHYVYNAVTILTVSSDILVFRGLNRTPDLPSLLSLYLYLFSCFYTLPLFDWLITYDLCPKKHQIS